MAHPTQYPATDSNHMNPTHKKHRSTGGVTGAATNSSMKVRLAMKFLVSTNHWLATPQSTNVPAWISKHKPTSVEMPSPIPQAKRF